MAGDHKSDTRKMESRANKLERCSDSGQTGHGTIREVVWCGIGQALNSLAHGNPLFVLHHAEQVGGMGTDLYRHVTSRTCGPHGTHHTLAHSVEQNAMTLT
jgi:hypothetical protein